MKNFLVAALLSTVAAVSFAQTPAAAPAAAAKPMAAPAAVAAPVAAAAPAAKPMAAAAAAPAGDMAKPAVAKKKGKKNSKKKATAAK
jgi:hypothetical protein